MKKLFLIVLFITFIASTSVAGTWCQWSGTAGINCKSTSGTIYLANGIPVKEKDFNEYGYYERITTQPTLGADQVKDTEVWGFADNEISLTWTIRDLTAQEILERDAAAMSLTDYLQWKAIVQFTSATSEQIVTFLTANYPEQVIAYQARKTIDEQ